jgi:glycine/D-amino acid oxidase-like deaminating enzyme
MGVSVSWQRGWESGYDTSSGSGTGGAGISLTTGILWRNAPAANAPSDPLPATTDVVVIGGGYTGVSAARALARGGKAVVVLERETPGWGASSRNGGFVLPGFKRGLSTIARKWGQPAARRLFAESLESITDLELLIAEENISCQFSRVGLLTVAESTRQLDDLAREQDQLESIAKHPTRLVRRPEIAEEIGTARYVGGLIDESAGSVHPGQLFTGLLEAARRAGATFCFPVEATNIAGRAGDCTVVTSAGSVRAHHVLVATNGYSGPVSPAFRRRVIPIGSHIIATAPLDPDLCRRLIPRNRVVSDSRHLLHYFRLSPDHRLVFGGRAVFRPDRSGADQQAAAILGRDMVDLFPELTSTPVDLAWSGNVAFTRDQMPHVNTSAGVLSAGGYCGHGVAMAIYLGNRIGRHLAEGIELPLLASLKFPPIPLYRGTPWFLPAVGAWYRMLDWMRSTQ